MKTAVLLAPNNIKIQEVPKPQPKRGEILVKIKACGVCPTDVKKYTGINPPPGFPFILGHEAAGIIEELGDGVNTKAYKVGDRVVIGNIITCGVCKNCKNGNIERVGLGSCKDQEIFGVSVDGAFREYAPVPERIIYKLPDEVTFNEAALVEPVACCLNGVEKAEIMISDTVFVVGAGFMGLVQLTLAKLKGARVIISDVIDERLEVAKSLGADEVVNPQKENINEKIARFTKGQLADVVLCSVGGNTAITSAFNALDPGGRLVILGGTYPLSNIQIDPNEIHYKQVKIIGSVSYTSASFTESIQLLADKKIRTDILQSDLLKLEEIEKAFKDVLGTKGLRKCVIFD